MSLPNFSWYEKIMIKKNETKELLIKVTLKLEKIRNLDMDAMRAIYKEEIPDQGRIPIPNLLNLIYKYL